MPTTKTKPFLRSTRFLVALGVAVILLWAVTALAQMKWGILKLGSERTITVVGTSQLQQNNEVATFNATINASNEVKETAYNEASTKMNALIEEVKKFGIEEKDIKTTYVNVYQQEEPYFEDGVQKYKPMNWRASISLEIILRDITKADSLAGVLTSNSAGDLYGPNYSTDNTKTDEATLLTKAVENAREKANALASQQNLRIKGVQSVVEGVSSTNNIVYGMERAMGGGGADPAFAPGSSQVSKSVTVTYIVE